MPRISINQATTYHWSFEEDVTGYRAAGVAGIGVWRRKLVDFGEERGIEMLRDSGLAVSSYSCAGGFTGADGQSFREAVDDALEALRQAAEMRAGCLVVVGGAQGGHTLNHARRLLREALRELGDAAAELGVSVALQPIHREPARHFSFLTTLEATLKMLCECNHPRVGLVFDFFHLRREPDLCRRIPDIVPWIKLTAVTDAQAPARCDDDRCLPGQGTLPLSEMIEALEAGGYRGVYDVQILSDRCWRSDYAALLHDCRQGLSRISPRAFPPCESNLPQPAESTDGIPVLPGAASVAEPTAPQP